MTATPRRGRRPSQAAGDQLQAPRSKPQATSRKLRPQSAIRNLHSLESAIGNRSIGVFDSGIGGLTVLHELMRALPNEHLIYLGDTARAPYGTKSPETVRRYAIENTRFLVERGVKMLVVACNTMASVALDAIAARAAMPVIGVIEPGAAEAARVSRTRRIGVVGTEATIASGAYAAALRRLAPAAEIFTRPCPLFVPLAEEGWTDNDVARSTARVYLGSLRQSGIDTLLLGCTHYPLLRGVIADVMGPRVRIVDSAASTARATRALILQHGLARRGGAGSVSFFVTDTPERFIKVGERFLGEQVQSAVRVEGGSG